MPKYSILLRLTGPDRTKSRVITPSINVTIDSLLQQSNPDWELIIAGTYAELASLPTIPDNRVRLFAAAAGEAAPWVMNRLLPNLGEWVGTIRLGDRLLPETLAQLDLALQQAPLAKVVFTDEESCNRAGQISLRSRKGAINPLRLRSQEYLRDFALIQRSTLLALSGFNPMTSTLPVHDSYLQILEAYGPAAFCYVPHQLYQRFRDHREGLPQVGHDLEAVKQHLGRAGLPATVRQLAGQAVIEYRHEEHPWVTAVIVVHDDVAAGLKRIVSSQVEPVYRPATFRVVHVGSNLAAGRQYQAVCSDLGLAYFRTTSPLPDMLSQEAQWAQTPLLLFLQGEPLEPRWLHRLVDHARLPGAGAVGATCIAQRRLHCPGVLGHQYDGWDWNTAGRFSVMTVPHQTAAVSPACLLIQTELLLQFPLNPDYPGLYGMELCLRLDQAGFANVRVTNSRVEVPLTVLPPSEVTTFRAAWAGWTDRFQLHQAL